MKKTNLNSKILKDNSDFELSENWVIASLSVLVLAITIASLYLFANLI